MGTKNFAQSLTQKFYAHQVVEKDFRQSFERKNLLVANEILFAVRELFKKIFASIFYFISKEPIIT